MHPRYPSAPAIEDRVLTFLRREVLTADAFVERETALLSGELLDSMSVLRLAAFVGERVPDRYPTRRLRG